MRVTLNGHMSTFLISDKGNQSELISSIRQEVVVAGRQTLGIVVDTDDDVEDCWDRIKQELSREKVQTPLTPSQNGTIIPEQTFQPRVGIWLMPDNGSKGELEDFVAKMIPGNDPVWPLSRGYINQINAGDRKFPVDKTQKAELYSWLAARKEPSRMGAAVGAGDLDVNGYPCKEFLAWLIQLFG